MPTEPPSADGLWYEGGGVRDYARCWVDIDKIQILWRNLALGDTAGTWPLETWARRYVHGHYHSTWGQNGLIFDWSTL
jgi:hypothetical protein